MIDTKLLRQKILDLAIRGKLVPQDPADEPASELLKKIKAEKEALVKAGKIKKDKHESFIFKSDDNRYYETIDGKTSDITEEIPFDLPESWCWCRLVKVLLPTGSKSPQGVFFDYIDIDSINNSFQKITSAKHICVKDAPSRASREIREGDTLFSLVRPYLKNIAYISDKYAHCIASTGFYICRPTVGIDSRYLYRLMISDYTVKGINAYIKGDNSPSVRKENIDNFLIPLPPLTEQKRIVSQIEMLLGYVNTIDTDAETLEKSISLAKQKILDLAIRGKLVPQDPTDEPASELLKKIKAEKEALVKAGKLRKDKHESFIFKSDDSCYYEQLNGKTIDITAEIPFDLPESWSWCRLGNIGSWGAGATPSRNNKEYYQNGTIPWLKTGDLNDGDIYSVPEYITEKALRETSVQLNLVGSILIAMYGATIGKVGVLQIPATTNQACCACSVFNGIDNRYLFFFLLSQKENFKILGGGGAQPNISKDKIINYLFPLPPVAEQKKIVACITQYETILKSIQE